MEKFTFLWSKSKIGGLQPPKLFSVTYVQSYNNSLLLISYVAVNIYQNNYIHGQLFIEQENLMTNSLPKKYMKHFVRMRLINYLPIYTRCNL